MRCVALLALLLEVAALAGCGGGSEPRTLPEGPPLTKPALPEVDSALAELPKGSATVTAPSEVLEYRGFDVSLRLARMALADLIEDTRAKAPKETAVHGFAGIRMSPRMKAELIGEDFVIEEKGPREQLVTLNEDTIWNWRVHSETLGRHVLIVRLHTLLKIAGEETPKTIDVAETEIDVRVNPPDWALKNWEWIATALVLPVVGWGLKRLRDRKSRKLGRA
jgi:hypothetical protein